MLKAIGIQLILCAVLGPFCAHAQKVEWYEVVVVEEWKNRRFLFTQIDSIGLNCSDRRNQPKYCTEAEEIHDIKLPGLVHAQRETLEEAEISIRQVEVEDLQSKTLYKTQSYPFLIDYEYDLVSIEKTSATIIYLKYDFILIDRRSGKVIARSHNHDLEKPFEGLNYLIMELEKLSNGSWEGPAKF